MGELVEVVGLLDELEQRGLAPSWLQKMLGLGSADMPMSESKVVTVIPNTLNSFKLSVAGQMVGAISQDRATGIYGHLGRAPKMIPVKVTLHTSRGRVETYDQVPRLPEAVIVDGRDPGSTEVSPVYRGGRTVRFSNEISAGAPPLYGTCSPEGISS